MVCILGKSIIFSSFWTFSQTLSLDSFAPSGICFFFDLASSLYDYLSATMGFVDLPGAPSDTMVNYHYPEGVRWW